MDARQGSKRTINKQPYINIRFFFKKLPHVSDEYFHTHWSAFHADLSTAAEPFLKASRRYSQFHVDPKHRALAASTGMPVLDYDGCSELWVSCWEAWEELVGSPEYKNVFTEDNNKFLQLPFHVMVGYDDLIYGQAVPTESGKDGMGIAKPSHLGKSRL